MIKSGLQKDKKQNIAVFGIFTCLFLDYRIDNL